MMRILRGLGAVVLWLLASVVGLVAVILCVTLILLPLGLPLLGVARRLFAAATRLMLPKELAHPVKSAKRSMSKTGSDARSDVADTVDKAKPKSSKLPWRRRKAMSLS